MYCNPVASAWPDICRVRRAILGALGLHAMPTAPVRHGLDSTLQEGCWASVTPILWQRRPTPRRVLTPTVSAQRDPPRPDSRFTPGACADPISQWPVTALPSAALIQVRGTGS